MTATIKRKKRFEISLAIKIFLFLLLFVTVVVPLCFIFATVGTVNVAEVFLSVKFLQAMGNSFLVGMVAGVIAILFSFALAFAIARSNIRFKGVLTVALTVPMLIPSIAHGLGAVMLFGSNGILTRLFGGDGLGGFWSVIFGSVAYSFPTAFLMFSDIFEYEDKSVYEAADIMGIPKYRQFFDITLPYLKKPLISIFFAVFTLIFTDYGVVMMAGDRFTTLPLYMYHEVIGQTNFGVGAIVSIVLILPAVAAFIFDLFCKETKTVTYAAKEVLIKQNKKRDLFSYIFCFVSVLAVLLPIASFSVLGFFKKYPTNMEFGFFNFAKAFEMKAGTFFVNSLIISIVVGIVGTITSYATAYLTARSSSKANKPLHLLSILSVAIPGVVLGISYSLMYKGTFLMGTLTMLILVNIVHFFSSPYLMCYNALNKVNANYEIVAKTLKINKFKFFKDILLPQTKDTVLEMFSYFFVNSMVTISAVAFLATSANKPLSLLLNDFEAQMLIECSAVVSLMILIVNGLLKLGIYMYQRWRVRRNAK